MNTKPRDVLIEIVEKHGPALLTSPARCEGVLKDYCGEFRREIFVLVSCLRMGVVEQLRQQNGPSIKLACARLSLKLEQNLAISSEAAKWGVESWAIALGLLDPQAAASPIEMDNSGLAETQRLPLEPKEELIGESAMARTEASMLSAHEEEPPERIAMPVEEKAPPEYLAREPQPRMPLPDWTHPVRQIAVHPDASGQKPTLREALRDAPPNTCIVLRPGVYKEGLVVRKDLQLRGDGDPQQIILESLSASVLVLEGACLYMVGITLKGVSGKDKKAAPAVEIKSGYLLMEDCDLTSDSSSIMEVKGAKSQAVLHRCHLHNGKASGILFQDEASGYLEECYLYENKLSHVVIGRGCSPVLSRCKISKALMAGIYVNEGGGGLIEDCDIWDNSVAAVQSRRGGNPRVRHCRISGSERYGVLVAEQGEGLFEECLIFDNARAGVTIGQQSKPHFSACRICDNKGVGIEINERSDGEFLDCEIVSNEGVNILLKDESNPQFIRCLIHDSQNEGIQVIARAKGRFERCEIFSNVKAAAYVTQEAAPVFQQCVFRNGLENGVTLTHGAAGEFIDCEFTDQCGTAVMVGSRSMPRFERCRISKNLASGVQVEDVSSPTFQECAINQNGGTAFSCIQNSAPKMIGGEICENGGGLVVSAQGKGAWENVRFTANKSDGVLVSDGGRPVLKHCHIEQSEGAGVRFRNQAQGTLEEIDIIGSGGPGVEIEGGANPALRKVRVLKGKGVGIAVQTLAGGKADHCEVRDNAGGDWEVAPNARFVRMG